MVERSDTRSRIRHCDGNGLSRLVTVRRGDNGPVRCVSANLGATTSELVLHVSRQLGYRSTSAQLRALIEDRIENLVGSNALISANGLITALRT